MFVNTGLIKAADNEAQVAGVLAHEMSHVALRHGVSQMGRAQTWQTILGVAGAAAGMAGKGGGLVGTAINTGGSMGVGGILSKHSRDSERDADLNGARMLAAAGYNPIEMAKFFEKLEKQMGPAGSPKGLESWFASHPSPGRRVESVSEEIQFYPKKEYVAETGQFDTIKRLTAAIPPAKMRPPLPCSRSSQSRERGCRRDLRTSARKTSRSPIRETGRPASRRLVEVCTSCPREAWPRTSKAALN
jgi:predicted Zn-dependent protease